MRYRLCFFSFVSVVFILATQAFASCPEMKGTGVTVSVLQRLASLPVRRFISPRPLLHLCRGIGSVGIYTASGKKVYTVSGSTLDTFLPLSSGSYITTVQEWDRCGGSLKTNIPITVRGQSVLTYQYNNQRTGAICLRPN